MKKIRTLIVDDNVELIELLEEFLSQQEDFEVIATAINGKDGIEKVTQNLPDLVILDVVMPEYSGTYFMMELEKLDIKRPVVVVTSDFKNSGSFKISSDIGADIVMAKPFDCDDLVYNIRKYIKHNIQEEKERDHTLELIDYFDINYRGTFLIKDAIKIVKKSRHKIIEVPILFEKLVGMYDMSIYRVRWNVDAAIKNLWKMHKKEVVNIMGIKNNRKPNLRSILVYYIDKEINW